MDPSRYTLSLSPCGRYRYRFSQCWDPGKPRVCFIMLNPASTPKLLSGTALSKCVRYAQRWDYGSLVVGNLFAYRADKPALLKHADDPIGPYNTRSLLAMARSAELVVCAWGNGGNYLARSHDVVRLFMLEHIALYHLGRTKLGEPVHPLYQRSDLAPIFWRN